jgi:hypothetical protein
VQGRLYRVCASELLSDIWWLRKLLFGMNFYFQEHKQGDLRSGMMYLPIICKELNNTIGGSVCIVVKS